MATSVETFFSAWGTADAAQRKTSIEAAVAADVRYADPRAPDLITGVEALSEYVGMFSSNAPGWTAKVVKSDTVSGMDRATVAFGGKGPDGSDMVQLGQYFVEFEGDRIARLVGFVGTGEPE